MDNIYEIEGNIYLFLESNILFYEENFQKI